MAAAQQMQLRPREFPPSPTRFPGASADPGPTAAKPVLACVPTPGPNVPIVRP